MVTRTHDGRVARMLTILDEYTAFAITAVPEPSTGALMGLAAIGL